MTNKDFFELLRKCFSNALTDREATLNNAIINRINDVEKKLESIEKSEPSKALECLENIEADLTGLPKHVTEYDDGFDNYLEDIWYRVDTIKQALIQAEKYKKSNEEKNKNLDIIIKKDVDLRSLKAYFNTSSGLSEYNRHQREENELSLEEYNALKNMYKY